MATERLEKVSLFLRKYHDSKAVILKEYYDYSPFLLTQKDLDIFEKRS